MIGAFRNFELTQLALENKKGRAFFPEEFGVPAYDELIYVARADRTKDASLSRFLDAVEEGDDLDHQQSRRGVGDVCQGPSAARRQAEPAGVPRYAAALFAIAGGAGCAALHPLRRLHARPRPDQGCQALSAYVATVE